jgi:TolA-binding protein
MRHLSQATVLAFLAGWALCAAGLETEPPNPPPAPKNAAETKSPAKRGIHWYRRPARASAAEQEKYAYSLYQDKRLRAAANAYQALVYAWPDSPQAPAAQLALAKILQQREHYEDAFNEYQYLIEHYPGQFDYGEALNLQFQIANYLMNARTAKFLFFPGFEAPERAIPLFEKIIQNAPSGDKAPQAQLSIGLIHETNGEDQEAVAAYEILQNRYPDGESAAAASFHQAKCLYRISKDQRYDETALHAARSALVAFLRTYPDHGGVPEAQTLLKELNNRHEKSVYERARFYDRLARKPEAAALAYEEFLRVFPASDLAPGVRDRIAALRAQPKGDQKQ